MTGRFARVTPQSVKYSQSPTNTDQGLARTDQQTDHKIHADGVAQDQHGPVAGKQAAVLLHRAVNGEETVKDADEQTSHGVREDRLLAVIVDQSHKNHE